MSDKSLRLRSFLGKVWDRVKGVHGFASVLRDMTAWMFWLVGFVVAIGTGVYRYAPQILDWMFYTVYPVFMVWMLYVGYGLIRQAMAEHRRRESQPELVPRIMLPAREAVQIAVQSSAVQYRLPKGKAQGTGIKEATEMARDLIRRFMAANPDCVASTPHEIFEGDSEEFVAAAGTSLWLLLMGSLRGRLTNGKAKKGDFSTGRAKD